MKIPAFCVAFFVSLAGAAECMSLRSGAQQDTQSLETDPACIGSDQIRICDGGASRKCCFYEHWDGQGASICWSGDQAYVGNEWNDKFSSSKVDYGCTALGYEHSNYGGRVWNLPQGYNNFAEHDLLSSIRCSCATPKYNYLGCFKDSATRDLDMALITFPTNQDPHDWCNNTCKSKGAKYFGLQNSSECLCGNAYGRIDGGRANEWDCKMRCTANNMLTCGGPWRNSVYEVK
eukprot:GDKI01049719.1.p2 GENE.GDKI01049719.1~~GDKI01049719.1.p2  ORF type:complete len:233 (+),score=67.43 GDKI01049719.1:149-847(+)